MRLIKASKNSDDIISELASYPNEEGKQSNIEVYDYDSGDDAIILRDKNEYPTGYGLIVISLRMNEGVKGRNGVVFLGLSNYSKEDIGSLAKNKYFTMKKISEIGLHESVSLAMENAIVFEKLCISIDLDVLDKAFSPDGAVGGMTTRELIYSVQRLKMMRNLRKVEICRDNQEIIAKLVKEIAC